VAKHLINTPKVKVTVFWNSTGLHVFDCLPEDRSFDAAYFIDHNLSKMEKLPDVRAAVNEKQKFIFHMDNSPIYLSKAVMERIKNIPLELAPHLPYSSDLALSDFFLFSYLKQKLPVMNSAFQKSLRTTSGTSFLCCRRWFLKRLLCNGNFDCKHASNTKVPIFRRSK
jgi:hypothetical protein